MTGGDWRLDSLREQTAPLRDALEHHSLYGALTSLARLRCFLEHHVFAVWDFMCVLKALQQRLCPVQVPWLPGGDPRTRRLIGEIVLGEESDELPDGQVRSHFELYLEAMREAGAEMSPASAFLSGLGRGLIPDAALRAAGAPPAAQAFVGETLAMLDREPHVLAAIFAVGREQVIPPIFEQVVRAIGDSHPYRLRTFQLYLERHIGLDRSEHGPAALEMLERLCAGDPGRWRDATEAAIGALESRRRFWNAIRARVEAL